MTPLTARDRLARAMTERQLEDAVEARLNAYGWRWHHETDSRKSRRGFPDLVAVHPRQRRHLFAELKTETRKPTPEQEAWLADAAAAGAEAYLWRPRHLLDGTIDRTLKG